MAAKRTPSKAALKSAAKKNRPKYKRIVLKLSGESLQGPQGFGIHGETIQAIAKELKEVHELVSEQLEVFFLSLSPFLFLSLSHSLFLFLFLYLYLFLRFFFSSLSNFKIKMNKNILLEYFALS